jgi:hypothetical protein
MSPPAPELDELVGAVLDVDPPEPTPVVSAGLSLPHAMGSDAARVPRKIQPSVRIECLVGFAAHRGSMKKHRSYR